MGHEVLGVDADPKLVQEFAGILTHVVEADSTDERAMRQLGAGEFETAVVAIGTEIEASILTTAVLADLGVPRIVAKAVTAAARADPRARRRPPGRLPRAGHGRPRRAQPRRLDHRLLRARPGLRHRRDDGAAGARRQDARRGGGAQALRHHGRLHQARGRLVHLRDARRRSSTRATSSSSPARSAAPRPSASSSNSYLGGKARSSTARACATAAGAIWCATGSSR